MSPLLLPFSDATNYTAEVDKAVRLWLDKRAYTCTRDNCDFKRTRNMREHAYLALQVPSSVPRRWTKPSGDNWSKRVVVHSSRAELPTKAHAKERKSKVVSSASFCRCLSWTKPLCGSWPSNFCHLWRAYCKTKFADNHPGMAILTALFTSHAVYQVPPTGHRSWTKLSGDDW